MSHTFCPAVLPNLRAIRVWGQGAVLTALTLVVLCGSVSAKNSKPAATEPSVPSRSPKPEDCKTTSGVSNQTPSSPPKESVQSKADSTAKPAGSKSPSSTSDDLMKLGSILDEEQDLPGVSAECEKKQSESEVTRCQEEKSKTAEPQCERTSTPQHDLVLPASQKDGQQE
jgi:hypothetical protein